MPHNFDHVVVSGANEVAAGGGDDTTSEALEFGPSEDEIWDVLDVFLTYRAHATGSVTSHEQAATYFQFGLAESFLIGLNDIGGQHSVGEGGSESSRLLYATEGHLEAPIDDGANNRASTGVPFRDDVHLRFDPGDMRVSYPGQFEVDMLQHSLPNAAVLQKASATVYYRPEPRHG